jgi:heme/copper-type cytochrome/quinol oxidase subunit 4
LGCALPVFVLLASISVTVPVLYYMFADTSTQETLTNRKTWLAANNGQMHRAKEEAA